VSVISGRTDTVVATIPVTRPFPFGDAPFGVAVNPKTKNVYVAHLGGDTVSVISGRTNTVTATIAVGVEPFGIAVDPKTTTAYAANFHDNTVSVLAPCPRTSGPSRDS
jgi:YVTN family beta-propeller protein